MKHINATLALVLTFSLAQPSHAFFGWGKKAAAPAPIGAVIVELSGKVEFQSKDSDEWFAAELQQPLEEGDTIMTDARGSAVILFTDGSKIRISKNAAFVMEQQNEQEVKLLVKYGHFEAWVKKLRKRRWKVRTPNAVAAIRGTDFVIRLTSPDGSTKDFSSLQQLIDSNTPITVNTTFELFSGSINVSDGFGNRQQLAPGQKLDAGANTGIKNSKPTALPPGKKMAIKPSTKKAAGKAAKAADLKAKKAKKKAEDAEKAAKAAKKNGDTKAAAKAEADAAKARKEQAKAERQKIVADKIVAMEDLSDQTTTTTTGGTTTGTGTDTGTDETDTTTSAAQDELVEELEGIATDVSPSSP